MIKELKEISLDNYQELKVKIIKSYNTYITQGDEGVLVKIDGVLYFRPNTEKALRYVFYMDTVELL